MSLWSRIVSAFEALAAGESVSTILERLTKSPEQTVAFAIAVIGLGAKMAKADGRVTRDEVAAFREVFHIPPEEEASAARVFNLARTDVAGFETYAGSIARMFEDNRAVLYDLLEGLFYIATADGVYHPAENSFLEEVARIFGIPTAEFDAIRARSVPGQEPDPYSVLGVAPDTPFDEIRRVWRNLVRESHPDQMIARGVPEEAVNLANRRLAAINQAWDRIAAAQAQP